VHAADQARELLRLHTDPELLVLVNVWDAASAGVVAAAPGCRAVATASHSIAAALGYPDGEQIPRALMLDMVGRIAATVDVPVTADLEAGYGDPAGTAALAIEAGAVGANLEDQMRPLGEAVSAVTAMVRAGQAAGVPFVVNARTDAFLADIGRGPDDLLADAVERGRAFLDAGAACVFVPGVADADTIGRLVESIGERRVSVLAGPGSPPLPALAELGVARVSYGPWTQRVAMTALADTAAALLSGGNLPDGVRSFG
jgi:2-methylisocitrate lyase-like PEP mutase family enzyme